ncbi:folate-binding protein YgfZ [Marivivens niveibacter]|uniref:Folate-binding protein YgfZ n=1 Tax=Marivivens niveibacter TaxID=1930667 RepID=A0A251X1S3_9RHOB|nr:folate-binding protein YgfZ [Marivivens niveibacter]OUD10546.1 folate-binding protein YgfZ [Marivivens niveibacter]
MTNRQILEITGNDRVKFLQGLVTNDVNKAAGGIIYAALLTPQGKYLADFFIIGEPDRILIDVDASLAAGLAQRLSMYKLRADVVISPIDMSVSCGAGDVPDGAYLDPRSADLGWRLYGVDVPSDVDFDALRVANAVPATGIELGPDSYILEMGFERLNGVDFKKGCYVGQEVTARMKHKTELKKGLAQVAVSGSVAPGTTIMAGEKEAGTIHTVSGDRALAYLRFDRADGEMTAGDAVVTRI